MMNDTQALINRSLSNCSECPVYNPACQTIIVPLLRNEIDVVNISMNLTGRTVAHVTCPYVIDALHQPPDRSVVASDVGQTIGSSLEPRVIR